MHDLNPKNLHMNGLIFLQNKKPPIFRVLLGIIPKLRFFPKNLAVIFLVVRHSNFMRSFRKILWAVLEKTRYLLTYWQWWNLRTPFRLRAGVQKREKNSLRSATLKVTLFHGYFSHFFNCSNGNKSPKAPQICI